MEGVLTGALALIKVNGTVVGRMRNIRATETIQRGTVKGIGTILTIEAPPIDWAGSLTCDFYEIDFTNTGIDKAILRNVQTNQEFEDNLLLNSDGVQIDVFKKIQDVIDPNTGKRKATTKPYAIIKRCFIESDGFDISEGAISGHNQGFKFLDPIIRPE